jgi:uncharacterized protein
MVVKISRKRVPAMLKAFGVLGVLAGVLTVPAPGADAQRARGGRLATFPTAQLSIKAASGRHDFTVEIARTGQQQTQGLMYRRRMAANAGMLFVYRRVGPVSMWMRNTYIPLDMLFIRADGKIAHIAQRTVPQSLETISSPEPVKSVLELNAGTAARLKLKIGDLVSSSALGR